MKVLKIIGWILLALIIAVVIYAYNNMRDRNSGYTIDLTIHAKQQNPFKVGFSALTITPQYFEYWHDNDGNKRFEQEKGDIYDDANDNGRFDTYWIAGFGNKVATNGVHDNIWARTMVIDDGNTRLAIVALDVIGFFHPMVIDIRKMLPSEAGITYLSMSATHTHEAPDLMGLWGESPFKSGVNEEWKEYVKKRVVESILQAVNAMRPATLKFSQNLTDGMVTLTDTREPYVYDHGLRMMQAVDKENGETLGTLIQWANHPETLWSRNLLITSDFPHYIREAVEKGVYNDGNLVEKGVGGIALYVNGAVGGLMTTHATTGVKDPFRDTTYVEPSFDKARAQGDTLGLLILRTMKSNPVEVKEAGINLRAKTFRLPLDNPVFRLAAALGIMEADVTGWMKKRTEVATWSIGPASFLTVPGEIYPEIVNGGIDALPGRDFDIDVQETPPLRELMDKEFRFVMGLTNDEIGYIIPKSQWDVKAPFVYREKAYYGEENSLGPNTAPLLYNELKNLMAELPNTMQTKSQASLPISKNKLVVIAHRGDHNEAPENTPEAYEAAIRNGADYIEIDLQTSKDGILVLHHDKTIDRTTDGTGNLKDYTWNELKQYGIPSFEDVLKLCKNRINIYLDHKDADIPETLRMIRAYDMEKQIIVYINKTDDYYIWRRLAPDIPIITSTNAETNDELLAFLRKYPVEVLDNLWDKELIETANTHNVSVWLDGKNENPDTWTEIINKGVQGIQTDKLKELKQFLKKQPDRSI